ncbi:MAG: TOBE domain-containing protein, partial [Pseudomonadota bacterium]
AKLRTVMRAELKHLQRELGTTTIYVTHDQVEAMTLADRIVILNDARIQQMGTPADIYARPANTFVAGFVGSPPMNLLQGRMEAGGFVHATGRVALAEPGEGPVTLGCRPEDVTVLPPSEGALSGTVYSSELLGDCTLLNVRLGETLVAAKVGPSEGRAMDEPVSLSVAPDRVHLFGADGLRRETRP